MADSFRPEPKGGASMTPAEWQEKYGLKPKTEASGAETDAIPLQTSGLPQWGQDYVQNMLNQYGESSLANYNKALKNLRKGPQFIEDQRVAQNSQWLRDLQGPMNAGLKSGINQLAGRGMINSSVSSDWLSRIAAQLLQSTARQQTESNVWASGMKYKNLQDQVTAEQQFSTMLGNYLGMTTQTPSWPPAFLGGEEGPKPTTPTKPGSLPAKPLSQYTPAEMQAYANTVHMGLH